MPDDAPVMVAARQMVEAFQDKGTDNVILAVLTDDKGLSPADENTYRKLVDNLRSTRRTSCRCKTSSARQTSDKCCPAKTKRPGIHRSASPAMLGSAEGVVAYVTPRSS